MPKRFQDAVIVTRKLGVQFLWIDSICIIQPHRAATERCPQGCSGVADWGVECVKMEEYFSSAYCTVAATCAIDAHVDEGFLDYPLRQKSEATLEAPGSVPDHSGVLDDFSGDVEDSELNRRGWVLQERALARRTIHFTSKLAYWECGGCGVRCETVTRLKNETAMFLSDHDFPASALANFEGNRIYLIQWLFERYSKCGLTKPTDRCVAISGLQKRLGETFKSAWRYGIFEKYFHRCLLWQRHGHKMRRIDRGVPSWSWMAYTEAITYMQIPPEEVEWSGDVRWPSRVPEDDALGAVIEAPARRLQLDADGEHWGQQVAEETRKRMSRCFIFDQVDEMELSELQRVLYAVMGRSKRENGLEDPYCYVLIIRPLENASNQAYERMGVGTCKQSDLSLECLQARIY
jgi:hypothetical protein